MNKGDTIRAKTHAEIGTIVHLSIIGVEGAGRLNPKECIEAFIFWEPGVSKQNIRGRKRAWRPVLFRHIDVGGLDRAPPILPIDAVFDLGMIVARFLDCLEPDPVMFERLEIPGEMMMAHMSNIWLRTALLVASGFLSNNLGVRTGSPT